MPSISTPHRLDGLLPVTQIGQAVSGRHELRLGDLSERAQLVQNAQSPS